MSGGPSITPPTERTTQVSEFPFEPEIQPKKDNRPLSHE